MQSIFLDEFILNSDITYAECIVLSTVYKFRDTEPHLVQRSVTGFLRNFMSRPTIALSFKNLRQKQFITDDNRVNFDIVTPQTEANTQIARFYPTQK